MKRIFLATYSAILVLLALTSRALADTPDELKRKDTFSNWQYVVGAATPFVLEFLLQSHWSKRVQAMVTFSFVLVTAFVGEWIVGSFDVGDVFGSSLKIIMVSMPVYYGLVQHLGIKSKTDLPPSAT